MNLNDMTTTTIHDRITTLVNLFADGNNSAFARMIGISESNIRSYIYKSVKPNFGIIEKLLSTFDISAEWFVMGEGSMLKNTKVIVTDSKDAVIIELQQKLIKYLEKENDNSHDIKP